MPRGLSQIHTSVQAGGITSDPIRRSTSRSRTAFPSLPTYRNPPLRAIRRIPGWLSVTYESRASAAEVFETVLAAAVPMPPRLQFLSHLKPRLRQLEKYRPRVFNLLQETRPGSANPPCYFRTRYGDVRIRLTLLGRKKGKRAKSGPLFTPSPPLTSCSSVNRSLQSGPNLARLGPPGFDRTAANAKMKVIHSLGGKT
jgi:hypothetical protein